MQPPRPEPWSDPSAAGSREVTEILLCLPVFQAGALEEAARQRGLTTGQILRRLIRDFLSRAADRPPG
jgi:hypothetical protein